MLMNDWGSFSGVNSSTSSSCQPLLGAEEFEGLLLEFGKPGHWSTGSLANRLEGLPALLVASLDSLLGVGSETWWWWTYPATGVALLHPSCECRSPETSGRCITNRWRGAVDPLPHLPAIAGRWHSLGPCFVAVGDGHGLLSCLAGWSCSQDGSPCLRSETGGFLRCDWKAGTVVGRRSWPLFQRLRRISRSGVSEE